MWQHVVERHVYCVHCTHVYGLFYSAVSFDSTQMSAKSGIIAE